MENWQTTALTNTDFYYVSAHSTQSYHVEICKGEREEDSKSWGYFKYKEMYTMYSIQTGSSTLLLKNE